MRQKRTTIAVHLLMGNKIIKASSFFIYKGVINNTGSIAGSMMLNRLYVSHGDQRWTDRRQK